MLASWSAVRHLFCRKIQRQRSHWVLLRPEQGRPWRCGPGNGTGKNNNKKKPRTWRHVEMPPPLDLFSQKERLCDFIFLSRLNLATWLRVTIRPWPRQSRTACLWLGERGSRGNWYERSRRRENWSPSNSRSSSSSSRRRNKTRSNRHTRRFVSLIFFFFYTDRDRKDFADGLSSRTSDRVDSLRLFSAGGGRGDGGGPTAASLPADWHLSHM